MKIIKANWKPCSVCLAYVGLGKNKVSKLLAVVSPNVISVEWRKSGINKLPITKASTWRMGPPIGAKGSRKKWYYKDIERSRKLMRDYNRTCYYSNHEENKKKNRERSRKRYLAHYKTDPIFRLKCSMKSMIRRTIQCSRSYKVGHTESYLGCSYADVKSHIERQFERGMSWSNYGEWEIDHIMPLAAFNLTDPNHLKQASHYTNLRPLWKHLNRIKSDAIHDHQALLL